MKKLFVTLMIWFASLNPVWAQSVDGLTEPLRTDVHESFSLVSVLQDGRVKPLDTYARNIVLRFSGKSKVGDQSALEWFSDLLFAPEETVDDAVFLINHPDIAAALNIEEQKRRRYRFDQLDGDRLLKLEELAQAAKALPSEDRGLVENEVIRVYDNLDLYVRLSQSIQFAAPHPAFRIHSRSLSEQLKLSQNRNLSFLDLALRADLLHKNSQGLEGLSPQDWSKEQKEVLKLTSHMRDFTARFRNMPFTAIRLTGENGEWVGHWDAIVTDLSNLSIREDLIQWQTLYRAYWTQDQDSFDAAVKQLNDSLLMRLNAKERYQYKTHGLEITYNLGHPFFYSKLLYILVIVLFCIAMLNPQLPLHRWGWVLTLMALAVHSAGLIARIIIMARPPVSNLYETFIFVSFCSVILCLAIEKVQKRWLGLFSGAVCGVGLLWVAGKYSAEGDTMQMLIAVLNSNFWLSTHVTTITAGYGCVLVAGVIGHVYLVQAVRNSTDKALTDSTLKIMIGVLGLGLTLSFLGTNLGGIWADQSWGRFWGWDPKENGALMIILWSAILLHARIAKLIGPVGFAAGNVIGAMVVMWAWFGVNLLSIGLHSYGFTSGVAMALLTYYLIEIGFLLIFTPWAKKSLSKVQ